MAEYDLLAQLLALPDHISQLHFLEEHAGQLDPALTGQKLKEQADLYLRTDIERALETAELLGKFSTLVQDPGPQALALLAEANARYIGLGEYEKAVSLYNRASQIYHEAGLLREQAIAQIGRIGALVNLGRYLEALEVGDWAAGILADREEWFQLAKLTGNLGIVHYRRGDDQLALEAFEAAQGLYARSVAEDESGALRAEFNRAIVLRNLGRFDESVQASTSASEALTRLGHAVDAARARQSLALTYYVLGKYNESLAILDDVRSVFSSHQRHRDAVLTELFISDCLLQLRRFADVLEKCSQVRAAFTELGTRFEVTLAILNEAVAYAGLGQYESARASLTEARQNFIAQDSHSWAVYCDLEIADIHLQLGNPRQGFTLAQECVLAFEDQPAKQAQARLIAARSALALGDLHVARDLAASSLEDSESLDMPSLGYAGHHIMGQIAERMHDLSGALAEYDAAINNLEKLRGRLMVEFRSGFLEDKQQLYEDVVTVSLMLERPAEALNYAERAKSRALLDLLAHRLDLGIHPRDARDQDLVDEIQRLKDERDRLHRRWEGSTQEELRERGWSSFQENRGMVQAEVLNLENQITQLWHQLLIRNADYARDASMWQVRVEPIQEFLDEGTLLLEFFIARGVILVFAITRAQVLAIPLSSKMMKLQKFLGLLWLNFQRVPKTSPGRIPRLTENARGLLYQLYEAIVQPLEAQLVRFQKLIIVPHGLMHYLPFQAFFNGSQYLLETHEISYLPGASFLRYLQDKGASGSGALVLGNTFNGMLPNTVAEAQTVAAIWDTSPYLEENASLAAIQEVSGGKKLIHFAAHGDFRPDNPLFSGISLADGWLTTLDIFNLRLDASLVVLSACETGRNVVGGGDELLGLMRAFLYAGADSLLLSLWAVEDRSTAFLMEKFNQVLHERQYSKRRALKESQLDILSGSTSQDPTLAAAYRHPYFWAPFILVGDPGNF